MSATQTFVVTKPGVESGETLAAIVARKEAERIAGNRVFWWGVGSSLGDNLQEEAQKAGGELAVLFVTHVKPGAPKPKDATPQRVVQWTTWKQKSGPSRDMPPFVRVTSRWDEKKRLHYALSCSSEVPLKFDPAGPLLDLRLCKTRKGLVPGPSQVTALVRGDLSDPGHLNGQYRILFQAKLIWPWQPRLVAFR